MVEYQYTGHKHKFVNNNEINVLWVCLPIQLDFNKFSVLKFIFINEFFMIMFLTAPYREHGSIIIKLLKCLLLVIFTNIAKNVECLLYVCLSMGHVLL